MKQLIIFICVGGLILIAISVLAVWGCSGKVKMTDPVNINEVRQVPEDEKQAIIESLKKHNKKMSKQELERMRKSLGGK